MSVAAEGNLGLSSFLFSLCLAVKGGSARIFSPLCVRLRKEADMWYMHFREIRNRLPPDNTFHVNSNFLLQLESTG